MLQKVIALAGTTVIVYAGLIVMMAGCQRHLIYFPHRASQGAMLDLASGVNLEPWRDDRHEIVGWRTPEVEQSRKRDAIVVFHGNAGCALHRTYFARGFASMPETDDWQVFIFEYPGYGARSGRPSEAVIKAAAEEAVQMLHRKGYRVFLVGESLGSGVACHLAGKDPEEIAGLLLITPFTSLLDVARHHYPFLPARLLLRERYDSSRALKDYHGPAVFLLAGRDEVIPTVLGRRLHDGYGGPKKLIVQHDRTHNTLTYEPHEAWWRNVRDFWLKSDH